MWFAKKMVCPRRKMSGLRSEMDKRSRASEILSIEELCHESATGGRLYEELRIQRVRRSTRP